MFYGIAIADHVAAARLSVSPRHATPH